MESCSPTFSSEKTADLQISPSEWTSNNLKYDTSG